MMFDGTDYMIDRGQVKHRVNSGWTPEFNLPINNHGGTRMLDVITDGCLGETILCYCQYGVVFPKRHGGGWHRKYVNICTKNKK